MYIVFFIPYSKPGLFAVFGSNENGPATLHVFTDDVMIAKMKRHLSPLAVAAEYTPAVLRELIEHCPYTHVCLNQDPSSTMPIDSFVRSLSAEDN